MLLALAGLAACASPPEVTQAPVAPPIDPELLALYAPIQDGGNAIPAVPVQYLSDRKKRQVVVYWTEEDPGTIIVDPFDKFLYFVMEDDQAKRYGNPPISNGMRS